MSCCDEARERERERWAEIAERLQHTRHVDWSWSDGPNAGRERMYRNHVVHAWRQAGKRLAKMLRANDPDAH